MFPVRWMGGGGPIPWQARSPDLNYCDYYLWGRIKNIVYQGNTSTRELTWMRIQQAYEIRRTIQALYERVDFCTDNHGRHTLNIYINAKYFNNDYITNFENKKLHFLTFKKL